jgi:vitamin B12 transporter
MTTPVLLVLLGALSRLLPHPPNFVPIGAIALFSGARLARRWAVPVPLAAMALSDFFLDFGTGRRLLGLGRLTVYATFAAIVFLGAKAAGRARAARIAALSVASSLLFFATSNLAVWLAGSQYPRTAAGLGVCFAMAVPFLWNTLAADLTGCALLFGLESLSRSAHARSWRVAWVLAPAFLISTVAGGQQTPPVSESVVVTATSVPEEEREVGSATTVITRDQIEKSGKIEVLELLRSVPGLDVVQSGTPGSLTSLFTRGTNSTHTLVLVDGARMNSPFFPGYDFSAMTTENVERIEIVRGPFSALYGSDAVGGVVQIFTRQAAQGLSGRFTGEAGNQGQGQGSGFVSAGEGIFSATGSFRYTAFDGDRANTDWRQRNGAGSLEAHLPGGGRVGLEASVLDGEVGNPGPVGAPSTARGIFHEERYAIPASFSVNDSNHLDVLLADVRSKPRFNDPDGGFSSRTDAETLQARIADTARVGNQQVAVFASWERWKVDDSSNFGTNLDGQRTTIWGAGLQDTATFGAFTLNAGFRYDHHSVFGDAWSPRGTISWLSADSLWKIRASGGGAFRAPTVGELYYPFVGNPDLKPERETAWELGAERYVGGGRIEVSLFWNDLRDLIVYDFAQSKNFNVGSARTRGVEVGWRQAVLPGLAADATYTYLDAENRVTGTDLVRRPRHRAALGLDWTLLPGLDVLPRVLYVGSRPDADPLLGTPLEDPSYVRVDLVARWQAGRYIAPYLRVANLFDRGYDEAAGYPAPGRLVAGGLEVKF